MRRLQLVLMSLFMAGWAGTGRAQSNITLKAVADTTIDEHSPTANNSSSRLTVRSYNDGSIGRQNIAYIRFDLSVLAEAPTGDATFTVFRDGSANFYSIGSGVQVFGLKNDVGNSPQAWDEAMNYNTSGLEVPGDGNEVTQDLDTNRVVYLGNLPSSSGGTATNGEPMSISSIANPALFSFITNRYADDGLATIMLVDTDNANDILYLIQSESASTNFVPQLQVFGDYAGPVVDTNPPTVSVTSPTNGAVDVDVATTVTVTFSEPIDQTTLTTNTFVLYDALSNAVPTFLNFVGGVGVLDPLAWLDPTSTYTAVVSGGPGGIADTNGNEMVEDYVWSFTTGETPVYTAPFSLAVEADTYLSNGDGSGPTAKHGSESLVQVRWHAVRVRMGYVRFDITGVNPSLYADATLSGVFNSASYNNAGAWDVWGLDDSEAGNYWDETTISYSTAAGVVNDAPVNTFGITNATYLGQIILDGYDPTNGTPPTFTSDTTNLNLQSFFDNDTDGKVTFIFMSYTNNGYEYRIDSKEGASTGGHGPMMLNFTAQASPPTATTIHSIIPGSGTVMLGWDMMEGHGYSVERTTSLAPPSWSPLTNNAVTNSYTDPAPPAGQAYYRVGDEGLSP